MEIDNTSDVKKIGWQWLWFLPFCFSVLYFVELNSLKVAWWLIKLGYHRWSWGALMSPSTGVCLGSVFISIVWPIHGIMLAYSTIESDDSVGYVKKLKYLFLITVVLFSIPVVTEAIIWGSFPFIIDDKGVSRLRMVPFLPWPAGHFGEL